MIRGINAPLFLTTKWEAYRDRGAGDLFGSHDLQDIIVVVAGRPAVVDEVRMSPTEVRCWVAESTAAFLRSPFAEYAVEGALPDSKGIPGLTDEVMARFHTLAHVE